MVNRIYVIILVLLLLGGVGLSFLGSLTSQDDSPNAVIIEERDVVFVIIRSEFEGELRSLFGDRIMHGVA